MRSRCRYRSGPPSESLPLSTDCRWTAELRSAVNSASTRVPANLPRTGRLREADPQAALKRRTTPATANEIVNQHKRAKSLGCRAVNAAASG
jgi:hypothetical protein